MQEVARSLLDLARKGETNLRGRCVAAAAFVLSKGHGTCCLASCVLNIGHRTPGVLLSQQQCDGTLLHQQQCEVRGAGLADARFYVVMDTVVCNFVGVAGSAD